MHNRRMAFAASFAAASLVLAFSAVPASAFSHTGGSPLNGCNGYVNQLKWGCAAWDHNYGSDYPNWAQFAARYPQFNPSSAPAASSTLTLKYGRTAPAVGQIVTYNGRQYRVTGLISQDGGGLVSNSGGTLVSSGAGNITAHLVASGAGN